MKIKISYQPGEEKLAFLIGNFTLSVLRKATGSEPQTRERRNHPPYRHIYISGKPPAAREQDVPGTKDQTFGDFSKMR